MKQYEHNGVEAFVKPYTNYTKQFKLDVLNYMAEHGTSTYETAALFYFHNMSERDTRTISSWLKELEKEALIERIKIKFNGPHIHLSNPIVIQ